MSKGLHTTISLTILAWAMICAALVGIVTLGGCAGPVAHGASAQRSVYLAEGDFSAALPLAVAYDGLPDCVGSQVVACSTPLGRQRVNAAARAARASLATAERLVRSDSAPAQVAAAVRSAAQDVAAFTALARSVAK